jgi:hypothetical protein
LDDYYTLEEGIMHAWILSLIVEELMQMCVHGCKTWFDIDGNVFDLITLLVYVPAFGLRMRELSLTGEEFRGIGGLNSSIIGPDRNPAAYETRGGDFRVARSWHGIAGLLFWFRIFHFFRVSRSMGPLWLVLVKVSWHVMHFFLFLVVALIGFGAAIVCATRPRQDPGIPFSTYLRDAIFLLYMEIFGEHFLDSFDVAFASFPQRGEEPSDGNRVLASVLLCLYLLFSSIVLTNLLIASENFFLYRTLLTPTK